MTLPRSALLQAHDEPSTVACTDPEGNMSAPLVVF